MLEAGRVLLCRCGQSANKPFCDSSHERAEFRSRPPQTLRERIEAETPGRLHPIRRCPIRARPAERDGAAR